MGILDQAAGALGGLTGKGGGVKAMLIQQVVAMLSKPGALDNLKSAFERNGLGNVLQSWLGSGQNLPISGGQIEQIFGTQTLSDIAGKVGLSTPDTASQLSGLLPDVIDKLSPDGKAPNENQLGGLLSSVTQLLR